MPSSVRQPATLNLAANPCAVLYVNRVCDSNLKAESNRFPVDKVTILNGANFGGAVRKDVFLGGIKLEDVQSYGGKVAAFRGASSGIDGILRSHISDVLGKEFVLRKAEPVRKFLLHLAEVGSFSTGGLKRGLFRLWSSRQSKREVRPNHLSAKSMFNPEIFVCGDTKLETLLQPTAMARHHRSICEACRIHGEVHPECYFRGMLDCIVYGWYPPINRALIKPRDNLKNSKNTLLYAEQLDKEFDMMIENGFVSEVDSSQVSYINPIGAVIKNSDKQRAKVLAKVIVVDSESLKRGSDILVGLGQSKIKCRASTDCTGAGLNGSTISPSFGYTTVSEALENICRNDFMAKGDISRYFYSFPLAEMARDMFGFYLKDKLFRFNCLPFGYTLCPYFCSTWSAEFSEWFWALGIKSKFMMDDFFISRFLEAFAVKDMSVISDILEECGFSMEKSKFGVGQQLTFLGLLIDTVSMTIRIDSISAGGYCIQLKEYRSQILQNHMLTDDTMRHLTGKLNWYSEVHQSGRLHIHYCWEYLNSPSKMKYTLKDVLIEDFDWWIELLSAWSNDKDLPGTFRIFSGPEVLANQDKVELCQSDASGTDGFGYVHATLDQSDFSWFSQRWSANGGDLPKQSHDAEIQALHHFVTKRGHMDIQMIIWISDSESGCNSINRANCRDPAAFPFLKEIYACCDRLNIQLLALWVPREFNNLADHLSHLAALLEEDKVEGVVGSSDHL